MSTTRRRTIRLGGALAALAILLTGSSVQAGADSGRVPGAATRIFNVQFSPFHLVEVTQPTGPSAGDLIVFRDTLLSRGTVAGDQVGSCVIVDDQLTANCTGVIRLADDATIAFSFVNSPPPHKTLAITGGTGTYRTVRGEGTLDENGDGTGTLRLSLRP